MTAGKEAFGRRWNANKLAVTSVCAVVLLLGTAVMATPTAEKERPSCDRLRVMARLCMAWGDYDKAQALAERALVLAATKERAESEVCSSLIELSCLYRDQGKLAQAEDMCRQGLMLQKKLHYENHPNIAQTLRVLGSIYHKRGDYRRAGDVLDEAIAIMLKSHQPGDRNLAPFYVDIAGLLVAQGHFEQAEDHYIQALELINASYGPDHLYTAYVLGNMAELYTLQGRHSEAQSLIDRTLAIQQKVYGHDHHLLAPTWLTMAQISQATKDHNRAETLLDKALSAVQKERGCEHPLAGEVFSALGNVYFATGRYPEAEQASQRAVEILENSLGPDNGSTATARNNLQRLHAHQQENAQPQDFSRNASAAQEGVFDDNNPCVTDALQKWALAAGGLTEVAPAPGVREAHPIGAVEVTPHPEIPEGDSVAKAQAARETDVPEAYPTVIPEPTRDPDPAQAHPAAGPSVSSTYMDDYEVPSPHDGKLQTALQDLVKTLDEAPEQAERVVIEDYSAEIAPAGRHDKLGLALSHLTETLRKVNTKAPGN